MTRDEVLQRMIYVEATPRSAQPIQKDVRRRGKNKVGIEEDDSQAVFDDFFEYEKDLADLTPARDTVSEHLDEFKSEDSQDFKSAASFIMMEEEENIASESEYTNEEDIGDKPSFEFIQCGFVKENGERCKKQAKKGQDLCFKHRKVIDKNKIEEEENV